MPPGPEDEPPETVPEGTVAHVHGNGVGGRVLVGEADLIGTPMPLFITRSNFFKEPPEAVFMFGRNREMNDDKSPLRTAT